MTFCLLLQMKNGFRYGASRHPVDDSTVRFCFLPASNLQLRHRRDASHLRVLLSVQRVSSTVPNRCHQPFKETNSRTRLSRAYMQRHHVQLLFGSLTRTRVSIRAYTETVYVATMKHGGGKYTWRLMTGPSSECSPIPQSIAIPACCLFSSEV